MDRLVPLDYSLNNPDTLTKYKTAAGISEKVLEAVSGACVAQLKIAGLTSGKGLTVLFRMVCRGRQDRGGLSEG